MGYRSEVNYVVKFSSKDEPEKAYAQFIKFYNWVKRHTVTTKESSADYAGQKVLTGGWNLYWNVDEQTLCFEANDVKWYDSYADVQWHEQLLEQSKQYSCATHRFVRVGEEHDDIVVETHQGDDSWDDCYETIYPETRIVSNFPEEIDFIKEVPNDTV
jgi:hypothetical protein